MNENSKKMLKQILLISILCFMFFLSYKFNNDLFLVINGFYRNYLAYPMVFLTAMADGLFVLMIAAAVYEKKRGFFWSFILAFIVSSIIVQLIKINYISGRPLSYYKIDQIFYAGEVLLAQSFPSGHSAAALVLSRYLAQGSSRKFSFIVYTLGILAAISRVYIGVHFPKDIIAGAGIGFFVANTVFYFAEKKFRHSNRPEYKYNNILIFLTGLCAAIFYLFFNNALYEPLSYEVNITASLFAVYFSWKVVISFFKIYRGEPSKT